MFILFDEAITILILMFHYQINTLQSFDFKLIQKIV